MSGDGTIIFPVRVSDAANPAAGKSKIFTKADGLYVIGDAGVASRLVKTTELVSGGSFVDYQEKVGDQSTTGSGVNALVFSPNVLTAGDYILEWSVLWALSSASQYFQSQVNLTGFGIVENISIEPKDTANRHSWTGFRKLTLTSGVKTFNLLFGSSGGSTATVYATSKMMLRKVVSV
jgi:hypothetical protein